MEESPAAAAALEEQASRLTEAVAVSGFSNSSNSSVKHRLW
ncbi:hypothetical protein ACLK19_29420 [Escherichia coli]